MGDSGMRVNGILHDDGGPQGSKAVSHLLDQQSSYQCFKIASHFNGCLQDSDSYMDSHLSCKSEEKAIPFGGNGYLCSTEVSALDQKKTR
jgi:hypothetical protein